MKVGDADFIQDSDLHLRRTRTMAPYNPEVINIQEIANDLRSKEVRGFGSKNHKDEENNKN